MDDKAIQRSLAERHAASVATALRFTGRPDSSFEHVEVQPSQAEPRGLTETKRLNVIATSGY